MGKRRLYDEDVHDVFDTFGVEVAIYFEAIRYRQQLKLGEFFAYRVSEITKNTGLSYKQQLRVHKILEATGWIKTKRGWQNGGGTITLFKITELAADIIKDTPRRRSAADIKRQLAFHLTPSYAQSV